MTADQVVTSFCNAINKGDLEGAFSHLSQDCFYHNIPLDPVKGLDAIKATLGGFAQALGSFEFEVKHQVAAGNVVMNERVDYFTPPGRARYGLPVAGVFEVKDGKITSWRDYFDTRQFANGTGLAV